LKILSAGIFIAIVIFGVHIVRSRFWDSKRIEKSVSANILVGSSEQTVVEWLESNRIEYRKTSNVDIGFGQERMIQVSGINPKRMGSLVIGSAREGLPFDDLYKIDIYFFFDKQGRLIKYDFDKLWVGL
jgi:hypothetical protein